MGGVQEEGKASKGGEGAAETGACTSAPAAGDAIQIISPMATSDACLSAFAGPAGSLCVGVSVTVAVAVVSEMKAALADRSASEKAETTSKPRVPGRKEATVNQVKPLSPGIESEGAVRRRREDRVAGGEGGEGGGLAVGALHRRRAREARRVRVREQEG